MRKDDKITDLDENTLRRYERNGELTNFVAFVTTTLVTQLYATK